MEINMDKLIKTYSLNIKQPKQIPLYRQAGGSIHKDFTPMGGFPPIYTCDILPQEDADTLKPREYSTHKTAVSIKDIMKKRRDVIPVL